MAALGPLALDFAQALFSFWTLEAPDEADDFGLLVKLNEVIEI
jgi:hypothetical protein